MFVNFSVHHHLRYLDMTEIDTFQEIQFPYLPEKKNKKISNYYLDNCCVSKEFKVLVIHCKFTTHLVIIISIVALLRLQDFVVFFWVGEMLLLDM